MSKKRLWCLTREGFSILELLVTLGVLGLLVALAMPTFSAYSLRQSKIQCRASVLEFLNAQDMYYLDNKNFFPLKPGEKTSEAGMVIKIGWSPAERPDSSSKYLLPELAMGFQPDSRRGYMIRATNVQTPELFAQTLVFSLRTNEGFHNNGQTDYQYDFKLFNRENPGGYPEWSTHGQWMVRNGFWFRVFRCPAWHWTPACQR
jgi:prepilin-type N-terminal cleavage/methylation domain-containing protein